MCFCVVLSLQAADVLMYELCMCCVFTVVDEIVRVLRELDPSQRPSYPFMSLLQQGLVTITQVLSTLS